MLKGFEPIYSDHSKTLILGSMPSVVSLEKQEYYGFHLNRFWKIMSVYSGRQFPDYDAKKQMILDYDFALWDVIQGCEREGSLDSKIKNPICSDILGILEKAPAICRIICNGKKAAELFDRHFKAQVDCEIIYLPSTSNANRTIKERELFEVWLKALNT